MFSKPQKQTYVISSPMEGVLMQDGTPLANTKILRSLSWTGREGRLEQEFSTDDHGRFRLPVHEEQLVLGKLEQFACSTYLTAEVGGQKVDIWYSTKFESQVHAETDNHPVAELKCDLANEELMVRPGLSRITTVCRWTDMPRESGY